MPQSLSPSPSSTVVPAPRQVPTRVRPEHLRERVESYIRREPVKAIVIATVAGLVVGRLIRVLARQAQGIESDRA